MALAAALLCNCLLTLTNATNYKRGEASSTDERVLPSNLGEERLNQAMDKRHIFYSTGWGASGSAASKYFKGGRPEGKRLPASASANGQKAVHGGPLLNGIAVPQPPSSLAAARLRQLFVSRGWGPGWA
ncbi:hypothetical protein RvY_18783 [Ramazzottius varieornatus]|uniref:Uncharacterized protein n=1 Tax=Ramazzottius varieornatus TaxID=947166 RepID=A0A1D1W712_RAMVA|nr:hypothetical protein RvY_18783 [Ramazzottius varieornatus]